MAVRKWILSGLRQYGVVFAAPIFLLGPMIIKGQVLFWGTPSLQFIPWWTFIVRSLQEGSLPFWNPYNGMGAPLIANYQAAVFYPLNWLIIPIGWIGGASGIAVGFTILTMIHLAWAGYGMARFLHRLEFPWLGQTIGGITYALGGYIVGRLGFFSMVWVAAWIPWIIDLADQLSPICTDDHAEPKATGLHKDFQRIGLGLCLCFAMQLLAGHAQLTWYTMILAGLWVLISSLRQRSIKYIGKNVGILLISALGAAGIAAIQLVPTFEYLINSQRADAFAYQDAMTYSFWPWRLVSLASPDFFGSPARGDYWGYASYWEDHLYMGVMTLLLAVSTLPSLIGVVIPPRREKRWELVGFGWGIVLLSLILALGQNTPIYPFLYRNIPTFDMFQAPARYLIWAAFIIPVLAAVGIERWHVPTEKGLYWFRLATAGAFAISLGAGLAWLLVEGIRTTLIRSTAITGIWGLLFGVMTLILPRVNVPGRKQIWQSVVLVLCLLDLLMIDWPLNPGISSLLFSDSPGNVSQVKDGGRLYMSADDEYELKFNLFFRFDDLQSSLDWYRLRQVMLPNLNIIEEIPVVNNFDPLVPERYKRIMTELNRLEPGIRNEWLSFWNVGWIEKIDERQEGGIRFEQIKAEERWRWYPCAVEAVGKEKAWRLVQKEMEHSPDPDRKIIVEQQINQQSNVCSETGTVKIEQLEEKPGRIVLRIKTDRAGWLEIKDSWYPGWRVKVSGRPQDMYIADFIFKAVAVNAGDHVIEIYYHPVGFDFAWMLSILVLLCVMSLWFRKGNQKRKKFTGLLKYE